VEAKEQIIADCRSQIEELLRENTKLEGQKEHAENQKLTLSNKLALLFY
jgi:hypothetical protein